MPPRSKRQRTSALSVKKERLDLEEEHGDQSDLDEGSAGSDGDGNGWGSSEDGDDAKNRSSAASSAPSHTGGGSNKTLATMAAKVAPVATLICLMCRKTSKQDGTQFAAEDQCVECFHVAQGWPGVAWRSLVQSVLNDPALRKEWERAAQIVKGTLKRYWDNASSVNVLTTTGFRFESSFWFITLPEFLVKYLVPASELNLPIIKTWDEEGGVEVEGVLARVQSGDPPDLHRRVTLFSETKVNMSEEVLPHDRQLRELHAVELFRNMCTARASGRSEVLRASKRSIVDTLDSLCTKATALLDERRRAAGTDGGGDAAAAPVNPALVAVSGIGSKFLLTEAAKHEAGPGPGSKKTAGKRRATADGDVSVKKERRGSGTGPGSKKDAGNAGLVIEVGSAAAVKATKGPLDVERMLWGAPLGVQLQGLRKSRDSQPVKSGKAYFQLCAVIEAGEEAAPLRRRAYQRASPSNVQDTWDLMVKAADTVVKADFALTPNICRRMATVFADKELLGGNAVVLVRTVFPVAVTACHKYPDAFSFEEPYLCLVPFTETELAALAEHSAMTSAPVGDGAESASPSKHPGDSEDVATARKTGWSLASAMVSEVLGFGDFVQDAFGSDIVFHMMKHNIELATAVFQEIVAMYEAATDALRELPDEVTKALDNVYTFSLAYTCVASTSKPITAASHEAFTSVFVTLGAGKLWMQTMVSGARASDRWKSLENGALRCAAAELRHGPALLNYRKAISSESGLDEGLALDLLKFCCEQQGRFREGLIDDVLQAGVNFACEAIIDLVDGPASRTTPGDKKSLSLQAYCQVLEVFEKDPQNQVAIAAAFKKARTCVGTISATQNADFLLSLDGQFVQAETEQFTSAMAALRGHDKVISEMAHIFSDILTHLDMTIAAALKSDVDADVAVMMNNRSLLLDIVMDVVKLPEKLLFPQALAERFIAAARSFNQAAVNYKDNKKIGNFVQLTKAHVEFKKCFAAADSVKIEPADGEDPATFGMGLRAAFESSLMEAFAIEVKASEAKIAEATTILNEVLDTARPIAGGLRDGGSWKASLKGSETLKELLTLTHAPGGLVKGPGQRVMAIKDTIKQALKVFKRDVGKLRQLDDPSIRGVIAAAEELADLSCITTLESQLARSLNKQSDSDKAAGVKKYVALYASVDTSQVHPLLWKEAQKHLS